MESRMHTSTLSTEPITVTYDQTDSRNRSDQTAALLRRAAAEDHRVGRRALLEEVVLQNRGVAGGVARRYRSKGIASEDLDQVAYVALVRAADKFDPSLEKDF